MTNPERQQAAAENPSRLLVVDDSDSMRKRIGQMLKIRNWTVVEAASAEEARGLLGTQQFDVLALDLVMPGESGLSLLREIRQTDGTTCIVMLTGEGDVDRANECAEAGADDFVEKVSFEPLQGLDFRLRRAHHARLLEVERERIEAELKVANEELRAANAELEELSQTDALTGLDNRRIIEQKLQAEVRRCQRYGRWVGVGLLDLDHFKLVNDTHGHAAGDQVLSGFGKLIRRQLRTTDEAGRYGGEEFLVVFPETDAHGVGAGLERIRWRLEQSKIGPAELTEPVTVSCGGTAVQPSAQAEVEEVATQLKRVADKALYAAKDAGRNRVANLPFDTPPE